MFFTQHLTARKLPLISMSFEYGRMHRNPHFNTLPPGYFASALPLIALLLPTFVVVTWSCECAFFSTVSFTWEAFGDLVLPLGACICAAAVFLFRNPMHALLSLLGVFFMTVLLYLIAGIAFVGLVFLIVYVGAVAVLFLFVIMLLNVKSLTSKDVLVQHASQGVAISGTAVLLAQLHVQLLEALNRALANGFLRDAVIEPTTGEAILYYIRYQAMDINALTGLYTLHAILFMIITSILLAALLGAIILATVTTERATALSDIRKYSTKALLFSFFFFVYPLTEGVAADLLAVSDVLPVPFSFFYEKARRDENIRNLRTRKQDTYDAQHTMFNTQRQSRPLHPLLHLAPKARRRLVRRVGGVLSYIARWQKVYRREVSPAKVRRLVRRPAVFQIYAAAAALVPLRARRYRSALAVRIMRRRWLWHWRRNRAAWLRRSEIMYDKIPRFAGRFNTKAEFKIARKAYYPWYTKRPGQLQRKRRLHAMRRFAPKLDSVLRLFGKRRLPPFQYLRLFTITKVYPWLLYWSWRVRAFCSFFICFMLLLPFIATIFWIFLEDQAVVWQEICKVHKTATRFFNDWTDLKHLDIAYSRAAAAVLIFPATVYLSVLAHPWFLVLTAFILSYNAVLAHGGELSDAEFHESRCNYWRRSGDAYNDLKLAKAAAAALKLSKRHPDKGREDLPWIFAQYLPTWLVSIIDRIIDICVAFYFLSVRVVDFLQLPQAYRCLCGLLKMASNAVKSVLPTKESIFESYPFVADVYAIFAGWYAVAAQYVSDVVVLLLSAVHIIWAYICRNFYRIEYKLDFLTAVKWSMYTPVNFTIIVFPLCVAAILYCLSTFVLLIPWRRMYAGVLVRRPYALLHVALLLAVFYICGILAPHLADWHAFSSNERVVFEGYWPLFKYPVPFDTWLFDVLMEAPQVVLAVCVYLFYFFSELRGRYQPHQGRALVFRNYYNYYLRQRNTYEIDFLSSTEEVVESLPSSAAAFKEISAEAKSDDDQERVSRIERRRRMIWRRLTYIPKYYDAHPDVIYRKHRWAPGFVTYNHYENPHHSSFSISKNVRRGNVK
jgi:NADH-quinone oxidoreductase subunit J